jgi:exodeoxyribonuclease-3
MKIFSFNVNGLRARLHQMSALIEKHSPDIICLQETKVDNENYPMESINELGYQAIINGQKGHYGVSTLYKYEPIDFQIGFPTDKEDAQCRLISSRHKFSTQEVTIINGYFPQGESRDHPKKFPYKEKFFKDLMIYLDENFSPEENIIILGDLNISPEDIDIGIGEKNRKRWLATGKCSFLPEEREWLEKIKTWGFFDSYRKFFPDSSDKFSWFDYRSRGFDDNPKRGLRIDHLWVTKPLLDMAVESEIDYEIRGMEKPSDHAPVWTKFEI